ncbi:MAG: hypothetical protein H7246_00500 [Phycisphaerae bacterium]|nr:hypothetical protein [Saprospiraceae bacterium]
MKLVLPLLLAISLLPNILTAHRFSLPDDTILDVRKADSDSLLRLSCSVSLNFNLNNKRASNYFFSAAVGASYQVRWRKKDPPFLQPSTQFTANFYQGTVGTSIKPDQRMKYQFEMVANAALTARLSRDFYFDEKPVRTFCNFNTVAVTHRYKNSVTLATNFVINPKHSTRNQQVGFGGFSTGDFALGYYNDGTPWNFIGLGDGYDRWWTGGGFFEIWSLHAPTRLGLYYDNFTGGNDDEVVEAFEIANVLGLAHVDFRDPDLTYFNRGQIMMRAALPSGLGMSLILSGDRYMVVQNLIHRGMDQSLYQSFANDRFHAGFFFAKPYQIFKP